MAQTEFERGWIAGANWMQRESIHALVSIDAMTAPESEEAKK